MAKVAQTPGVLNRTSLSGTVPLIQKPSPKSLLSSPSAPKPEMITIRGSPPSQAPERDPDRYVISEESILEFESHVASINKKCRALKEVNFAPIITQKQLFEVSKDLVEKSHPLRREAIKFLKALQHAETTFEWVGPKALEIAGHPFIETWNEFVIIVQEVQAHGIESMCQYITTKFTMIDSIIRNIAQNPRRDSVHSDSIVGASDSLRGVVHQMSDSIKELLLDPNFENLRGKNLESRVADIKSFMRVYSSVHFSEFMKSGFSQYELIRFKSNIQTGCNEIIGGLRAGFAFPGEMNSIMEDVEAVQKHLELISKQMNMPQTVKRFVQKIELKDRPKRQEKPDALAKTKAFVEHMPPLTPNETSLVLAVKVEQFLADMSRELGVAINSEEDVSDKLNVVKMEMMKRIRSARQTEKGFKAFQDKLKQQSQNITGLMRQCSAKETESEIMKHELNQVISQLEERNVAIAKQRNDALETAKKREEQFFKIRTKFNESAVWQTLELVTDRLANFLSMTVVDRTDLTKCATELSEILINKGCVSCKRREEELNTIRDKLKLVTAEAMNSKETTPDLVSALVDDYRKMKREHRGLEDECERLKQEAFTLKATVRSIEKQTAESLRMLSGSVDGKKSPEEVSRCVLDSLSQMMKQHKDELEATRAELKAQHAEEMSRIIKELLNVCPVTDIDTNEPFNEIVVKIAKAVTDRHMDMTHRNEELQAVAEKLRKWMMRKAKCDDSSVSFDVLMEMVDSAENPLAETVAEERRATGRAQTELSVVLDQVKGILNIDDKQTPQRMEQRELLEYSRELLESLHDKIESDQTVITHQSQEIQKYRGDLLTILSHVNRIVGNENAGSPENMAELIEEALSGIQKQDPVPIFEMNEMTQSLRQTLDIESANPREYIPIITDAMLKWMHSVTVLKEFEIALNTMFTSFDFDFTSYQPGTKQFGDLRKNMLKLHGLLARKMAGNMNPVIATVVTRLISLASAFFGYINR